MLVAEAFLMLDLIKAELREQGVSETQFISFNFESLANAKYCRANALYEELADRISGITGKSYLFLEKSRRQPHMHGEIAAP